MENVRFSARRLIKQLCNKNWKRLTLYDFVILGRFYGSQRMSYTPTDTQPIAVIVQRMQLTELLRQNMHDLLTLSEVIFALAAVTQVEEAKVDRLNGTIWRITSRVNWWHIPAVARVTNHEQDQANDKDTKRQPWQASLTSRPLRQLNFCWHHLAKQN